MRIAAALPFMSIYHLPHGQYGYCGHVVKQGWAILQSVVESCTQFFSATEALGGKQLSMDIYVYMCIKNLLYVNVT